MKKWIQAGLALTVFSVPLIFSHQTTEIYGLIKAVSLELFSLILLILWLISLLRQEPQAKFSSGPVYLAVLAYFAVCSLSLIKATNIYLGLSSLYLLSGFLILFFLISSRIEKISQILRIMLAGVMAGFVSCVYSILQNKGINLSASRFEYISTFGNPIFFAQYLVAMIPLSLALCLYNPPARSWFSLRRIFFGLATLLILLFLLLTRSFGAYLGLVAGILVMAMCMITQRKLKRVLIWGVVSVFTLGLAISWFSPATRNVFSTKRLSGLMRVYVWQSTLKMVSDHPVLGVGAGNFRVFYPLYRSDSEKKVSWKGVNYFSSHNDFLQAWAETGTLGLVCFLGMLWALLRLSLRTLERIDAQKKILGAGLLAGLTALLVVAFFNPALQIPSTGMCFWVLAGLMIGLGKVKE